MNCPHIRLFPKIQIVATVGFCLLASTPPAVAAPPPNFVVILADDLGYGDLGVYGNTKIRTPRIDRMAAEGVRLTEFYSAAPTCSPSRAALLTGRYPVRSGMTRVMVPKEKWGLPAYEITLAESLKELGYATACIGKWHVGGRMPYRPLRNGFDYFFGLLHSNDMSLLPWLKWPRVDLIRNDEVIESPAVVKTLTERYTAEAIRFIAENRDRPFFLYLPTTMPHTPLQPSDRFRGKSAYGPYGDVVEELDWSVGEILDALEDNGVSQNTLTVLTSDNGPRLMKDGTPLGSTGPLRAGKGTTWEGGMRVPFVANWPGRIPANQTRDGIATTMDLFATIVELAGGQVPDDRPIDGRNILALLDGTGESPHTDFYFYFRRQLFAVRSGHWKLHLRMHKIDRKGQAKGTVECDPPVLYDLTSDPGESENLADAHPDIVKRLTQIATEFDAGVDPVMKLPKHWKSVASGLITQAPKNPTKVPK